MEIQEASLLQKLKNLYRPYALDYFASVKASMATEKIQEVLKMMDNKMIRNVEMFCFS